MREIAGTVVSVGKWDAKVLPDDGGKHISLPKSLVREDGSYRLERGRRVQLTLDKRRVDRCILGSLDHSMSEAASPDVQDSDEDRQKGTVKWFNDVKGFGFIKPEHGSKDHFVHISALQRAGIEDLFEGDKVSYLLAEGKDGRLIADRLVVEESAWV